jgi:hypothetical protein
MHLPHSNSAVLVLRIPPGTTPATAGFELQGLSGIAGLIADPERGQLLVRFDPSEISADEIRSLVLPETEIQLTIGPWLIAWPAVAQALPIAVGLL